MNQKKIFVIPSLLAAGFTHSQNDKILLPGDYLSDHKDAVIHKRLELSHKFILAGHRSHSSHSSHRSSSGGSYSTPFKKSPLLNSNSTPPSSILPNVSKSKPKILPGNTGKFKRIAMLVQIGLQAYGYYSGSIDGIIGGQSKTALANFQKDYGIKSTGTITPETLNALGIIAE